MDTEQAYDSWSAQYDTNRNRTRDLEGVALREVLADVANSRCLEIGCGTGKNTVWLATRCTHITAVDLSAGMLELARAKVSASHVTFHQADILQPWNFVGGLYDLVTFSLVLEHIEDLGAIMRKTADVLTPGGRVYIGELHPFKQYGGTKARFETEQGTQVVPCFDHHLSDFVRAAKEAGLHVEDVREFFDADEVAVPPRVLVLILRK
jgi:ubiquinone/menaquinone biosynthesis C-methylase UbiE